MIQNDQELQTTRERIARLEDQVARLRQVETNPANHHASASGFLAEIDRMQLEVREYLSLHPAEIARDGVNWKLRRQGRSRKFPPWRGAA